MKKSVSSIPSKSDGGVTARFRTTLLHRAVIARDTIALHFARPDDFIFKAGQNIDLWLPHMPEGDTDGSRTFSIASAPDEDEILIAVRLRDNPYKRALSDMKPGDEALFDGPFGIFILHQDVSRPAVFLAGGIGITPALSILRAAVQKADGRKFYLFYSNRKLEDASFHDELNDLTVALPGYKYIPTFTRASDSEHPWDGETGYISMEMIGRYVDDLSRPIYYLVGPTAMVWGLMRMLDNKIPRNQIKIEDFTGF